MMEDLEYIDSYFRSTVTPAEKERFEQRIITDPSFADTVAFYLGTEEAVRSKAIEEKKLWFRELYNQHKETPKPGLVKKLWPYLAAAAVITGIAFLLNNLLTPLNPQQLANEYITSHLNRMEITMGPADSFQLAIDHYNKGNYPVALQLFEAIAQKDTSNTDAKIKAGIVSLKLKKYDQAIGYFERLERRAYVDNPCMFLHALTLLNRNQPHDKQDALKLLQQVVADNRNSEETEVAKKWLEKL